MRAVWRRRPSFFRLLSFNTRDLRVDVALYQRVDDLLERGCGVEGVWLEELWG